MRPSGQKRDAKAMTGVDRLQGLFDGGAAGPPGGAEHDEIHGPRPPLLRHLVSQVEDCHRPACESRCLIYCGR